MKHIICLLGLIFGVLSCAFSAEEKKVLIIGNSYTFYNDLPKTLQALSNKTKYPLKVDSYTAGAMSLRGFLDDPSHKKARQLVETGDYDWLILQDQSQTPAYKPDETMDSVRRWTEIAKKNGTRVMLFLTWAHASADGKKITPLATMQEQTSTTYCKAAIANSDKTKIKVAPVGEAWALWYKENPDKPLHLNDMSHPNAGGTYLAACVIHASLTGKAVKGIPATLKLDKRSTLSVPKALAKKMQATANTVVKGFTPQGYLDEMQAKDAAMPSAADVKAALHAGITAKELMKLTGKPVHTSTVDKRKTYQFRIRDGAELAAYCDEEGVVENISIATPGKPVEIIDVTKL